jgi:hypothetical protein
VRLLHAAWLSFAMRRSRTSASANGERVSTTRKRHSAECSTDGNLQAITVVRVLNSPAAMIVLKAFFAVNE